MRIEMGCYITPRPRGITLSSFNNQKGIVPHFQQHIVCIERLINSVTEGAIVLAIWHNASTCEQK